jgi:hypothetical protein
MRAGPPNRGALVFFLGIGPRGIFFGEQQKKTIT